jgi:hypothetical protein
MRDAAVFECHRICVHDHSRVQDGRAMQTTAAARDASNFAHTLAIR